MVESERSHRGFGSSTSDFFLCFSSRSSSSSSMKMSSKSTLSPGRNRDPPTLSLSSSLSRRLRSNGSMKGGGQASPMFSTGSGKKKGGSFEPPEPSSPKVTCIGQVRVKSKRKHGRKLRTNRSQRRGEVSFRKTEQNQDGNNGGGMHHQQQQQSQQECLRHRNQRWVHLPLSICETLRSFGAEFNCFGPCGGHRRSSCSWSNEREKSEKRKGTGTNSSSNSCGAVFARWLFALQESEEDKGKEIEQHEPVVVRDEVEKRNYRENREIEMEITEEKMETRGRVEDDEVEEEEVEEGREIICIPPKNALLLMRSRSAPFRMSSLANRFWDSPGPQDKEEDDDEEEEHEFHNAINGGSGEKHRISDVGMKSDLDEEMVESLNSGENPLKEEEMQDAQSKEEELTVKQEEIRQKEGILVKKLSSEDSLEEAMLEMDERAAKQQVELVEKKEKRRVSFSSSTMYLEPESEPETDLEEQDDEEIEAILEERSQKSTEEESSVSVSEDEKDIPSRSTTEADQDQEPEDEQIAKQIDNVEDEENQDHHEEDEEQEEKSLLPDCLLLMMCEPKLSMEVSKETWVCSRDFIRFRPTEKKVVPQKTNNGGDESTKKRLSTDTNPIPKPQQPSKKQQKQQQKPAIQIQPARSSCSKVEPLVAAIEKKLTDSRAYEPFVLKRCKSEPMRNSAKLAPEVCFWNKNKIETNHHQPPSVGVGATGLGF